VIKGVREGIGSILCVAVVLGVLVSVDPRVKSKVGSLISDPNSTITPMGDRVTDVFAALWMAAKDQSIENAPLLVFAVIGALLFLFMFKT
jgi:hypothetical protein